LPIAAFIGLLGSGKTLGAVAFAKELKEKEGLKVLANCHIAFGELVNPIDLIQFELNKCVLIIDEAYTVLDSRTNTKAGQLLGYFLKQSRKRDVWVFYTSQRLMDVDIRLRQITNRIIYCEKSDEEKAFSYTIIEGREIIDTKLLTFKQAEKIYVLYDTRELIMPMGVEDNITNMDHLKQLIEDCSNQQTFVTVVRKENPFIEPDTAKALYTLLKAGKFVLAESLIRPPKKLVI
jgi:SpoVK/Ycf46/Vps4 family AAA+-type ATPase